MEPEDPDNPNVALVVTCTEAMEIWYALRYYDSTHRKTVQKPNDGKWGHYDCPPKVKSILRTIEGSVRAQHPKFFEKLFGGLESYLSRD